MIIAESSKDVNPSGLLKRMIIFASHVKQSYHWNQSMQL